MPYKDIERQRAYHREYARRWREANSEKYRGYRRERYAANLEESREKGREHQRKQRAAYPEKYRDSRRKRLYGLTQIQWDMLFASQGSRCAICEATEPGGSGRWHTDHCHANGHVRGILCNGCNRALGFMGDDATRLRAAAGYLEATAAQQVRVRQEQAGVH